MNDSNFDLVWSRVRQVVSFLLGVAIFGYETLGEHLDRPWLLAAATGLVGIPLARTAESALEKLSSRSNQIEPGDGGPSTPKPTATSRRKSKPLPEQSNEESAA